MHESSSITWRVNKSKNQKRRSGDVIRTRSKKLGISRKKNRERFKSSQHKNGRRESLAGVMSKSEYQGGTTVIQYNSWRRIKCHLPGHIIERIYGCKNLDLSSLLTSWCARKSKEAKMNVVKGDIFSPTTEALARRENQGMQVNTFKKVRTLKKSRKRYMLQRIVTSKRIGVLVNKDMEVAPNGVTHLLKRKVCKVTSTQEKVELQHPGKKKHDGQGKDKKREVQRLERPDASNERRAKRKERRDQGRDRARIP